VKILTRREQLQSDFDKSLMPLTPTGQAGTLSAPVSCGPHNTIPSGARLLRCGSPLITNHPPSPRLRW
jgi:hypothetical protein